MLAAAAVDNTIAESKYNNEKVKILIWKHDLYKKRKKKEKKKKYSNGWEIC